MSHYRHLQHGVGGSDLLDPPGHTRDQGVLQGALLHPAGGYPALLFYEFHHRGAALQTLLRPHPLLPGLQLHCLLRRHPHQDKQDLQDLQQQSQQVSEGE